VLIYLRHHRKQQPRKASCALGMLRCAGFLPIGADRAMQDHSQEWRLRHPKDAP
jgi:hypothetical protein